MESRVIFLDGMDNDPADFNNLQDFAQRSLDHLTADGVTSLRKYAGFQASAASAVAFAALPGRLYSGGKIYNYADSFAYDFTTALPLATRKVATLVVWGEEVDTDVRPREFLINEETGASEPRPVALERQRAAKLAVVLGTENADPSAPILDSGVTAVANIVLTPAGINSITMVAANGLDSVQSVADRAALLETFRDKAKPQIASLANDIAALTEGQAGLVGKSEFGLALGRIEKMEQQVGINSAAIASLADSLVDLSKTDTAQAGYDAIVEEGVRFNYEASSTTALQIFDGLNPRAKIVGGVLFPAYTREKRLGLAPQAGELGIAAYTYQAHNLVQKTVSRYRVRHGVSAIPTLAGAFLRSGAYNPITNIFQLDGEALVYPLNEQAIRRHAMKRTLGQWVDAYEDSYWDAITVPSIVNGAQIAQTFLQGNDMWLDAVGLTFTRLAGAGDITIGIAETANGMPKLDSIISKTTFTRDALTLGAETVLPIQPVFLTGGKRYAIVILTAADHWVATVAGDVYGDGTFFYVQDGQYQQGDGSRDVMFSLYAAKFASARAVIDMQPLSLAGGIAQIDILAQAVVPGSTSLVYEIQVGGIWYPLMRVPASILSTVAAMPPLLPLRVTFTGTPDVMPALTLTNSQVKVSRPKAAFTYFTAVNTIGGAGSTQIRALIRLESFDATKHAMTCKLRTGAGYTTVTNATSVSDKVNSDGSIDRTVVFSLGAAVTSFKLELDGTTTNQRIPFKVGQHKSYAL
jgi:hypothetical protein